MFGGLQRRQFSAARVSAGGFRVPRRGVRVLPGAFGMNRGLIRVTTRLLRVQRGLFGVLEATGGGGGRLLVGFPRRLDVGGDHTIGVADFAQRSIRRALCFARFAVGGPGGASSLADGLGLLPALPAHLPIRLAVLRFTGETVRKHLPADMHPVAVHLGYQLVAQDPPPHQHRHAVVDPNVNAGHHPAETCQGDIALEKGLPAGTSGRGVQDFLDGGGFINGRDGDVLADKPAAEPAGRRRRQVSDIAKFSPIGQLGCLNVVTMGHVPGAPRISGEWAHHRHFAAVGDKRSRHSLPTSCTQTRPTG